MLAAMSLAAVLCVFIGTYPWLLYSLLPMPVEYVPYEMTHVIAQLQLLFFSALAFTWLKLSGLYPPELPSVNLDVEWLYRKLAPQAIATVLRPIRGTVTAIQEFWRHHAARLRNLTSEQSDLLGMLIRTWPTGSQALWAVGLLGVILLSYYLNR